MCIGMVLCSFFSVAVRGFAALCKYVVSFDMCFPRILREILPHKPRVSSAETVVFFSFFVLCILVHDGAPKETIW